MTTANDIKQAVIISSGNEVTTGQVADTNAAWLADELARLDISIAERLTVPDDKDLLIRAMSHAEQVGGLVIITGGLGPTRDDLTRYALAELAGVELVEQVRLVEAIEAFFRQRGRTVSQINRVQALLPQGAEALDNPVGTAAGIAMRIGEMDVFALPGVPREMKMMFTDHVKPRISGYAGRHMHRAELQCCGAGESDIMQQISGILDEFADIQFGTRAAEGVITLKLAASDRGRLADVEHKVRGRLGRIVFGEGDQTLAEVIGTMLRARGETLAVAESCTGGLLGRLLTDAAGSSDYFVGGWICYSNEFKQRHIAVPQAVIERYGGVSEQCVRVMHSGALTLSAARWAIAVTGIAGPSGGSEEKPVGLVHIAVGNAESIDVKACHFGQVGRGVVRYRAAITAMNMLRLMMLQSDSG